MSEFPPEQPGPPQQYPQTGGFAAPPPPPYTPPAPAPPPPPAYTPPPPTQDPGYAYPPTTQQPAYSYPPAAAPPPGPTPPSPLDQPGSKRSSGPLVLAALIALLIGGAAGYFIGSAGDDEVSTENASAEFEEQIEELATTNADLEAELAEARAEIEELGGASDDETTTTEAEETETTEGEEGGGSGNATEAVDAFCSQVDEIVAAVEGGAALSEITGDLVELGEVGGELAGLTDMTPEDATRLQECSSELSDAVLGAQAGG